METINSDNLNQQNKPSFIQNRKQLLPWWVQAFMWLFMIVGVFVPVVLVPGLLEIEVSLAFYGMETNEAYSMIGLCILSIFILKGITGFALYNEKDWAIKIGIVDAIFGIIICLIAMVYPLFNSNSVGRFSLRGELLILIPYLLKFRKIKPEWESFIPIGFCSLSNTEKKLNRSVFT